MALTFIRNLHTLSRILSSFSEQLWAKDGYKEINIGHLQPLLELSQGDYSNNQLAEKTGMTKQSMNRLVKELVELGYVKIGVNEKDARVVLLKLSPKGKGFLTYLEEKNKEIDALLGGGLPGNSYLIFKDSIQTMLGYVKNLPFDL